MQDSGFIFQKVKFRIAAAVLAASLTAAGMAQGGERKEMPQYLFPEFSECSVLLKDNQVMKQVMNYNTITEKMVFLKDGNYYDMMNPGLIDTVYIHGSRFIPVNKMFYEVLLTGTAGLFIQHKSGLVTAGKPVGYGSTSQGVTSYYLSKHELSPEFINIQVPPDVKVNPEPLYWVRFDNEMISFRNEKEFISLFPEKSKELREFIRANRTKIEKRSDLIELFRFAAGL